MWEMWGLINNQGGLSFAPVPSGARGQLYQAGIRLEVCIWPRLAFILVTLPCKEVLTFPKLLLVSGPLLTVTDFAVPCTIARGLGFTM